MKEGYMNTTLLKNKKMIFALSLLVVLSGCNANEETNMANTSESSETSTETNTDTSSTDTATADNTIEFGSSISASGGAEVDGDTVTITESGSYNLSGTGENQYLVIDDENLEVELTFDNLDLTSELAAIQVINAKVLTINLVGESSIIDGTSNEELQAPIYIDEVETTLQGDGTLNLTGNCQEGFESNNDLIFESGTYNITAVDDGLNVGDNLIINGGTFNIDSNGDGLDSNGSMEINGGTIYVSGGNNGNGPIDYAEEEGETFELNGGTLIAVGGNMGVSTTTETQLTASGTGSGTTIKVGDIEWTAPKEFSYYFVSTPDLTEDTEITVDGTATTDTTGQATGMGGGGGGGRDMGAIPTDMGDMSTMTPPDGTASATTSEA